MDTRSAGGQLTDTGTAGAGRLSRLRGHPWLTLVVVSSGAMMVALDSMVVTVAQPVIQQELSASFTQVQWVTTGYLLAVAVLLVGAGKLGDRFGHRRVFLIGVVGFTATSVLIGLSSTIVWVIALRVLQGVFGALMQPATLALLRLVFPPDRLMMPIAIRSAVLGGSTAAGPILGGLVVEHLNWQAAFYLNLPIGIVTLVLAAVVLRGGTVARTGTRFDVPGLVLLASTLALLLWAVTKAPERGFGDGGVLGALITSVLLGATFVWWEGRAADPLLPLSLFRSVPVTVGVTVMTLISFVLFGVPFLLTFYLQNVLGLTPAECGIQVLWLTLVMVVGGPVAGAVMSRTGPRIPVAVGLLLTGVALIGLLRLGPDAHIDALTGWFVLMGMGFSPVVIGATRLILSGAPRSAAGVAGGLQQTAMQIGGSLGTAVLGAVVAARVGALLPERLSAAGAVVADPAAAVQHVSVGESPVVTGVPAATAASIADTTFVNGMDTALAVTAALAFAGAVVALFGRLAPSQDSS
ncbi:DHA2 family efflux MFS transporter permease subunit [Nucisporomicrobium flavum]|uniref:DHA2 family efflux MFS transporter permease subunit n=1 Tax=Nucisporomicrobium flavum TaxID=2785915 RepID=UPI0018F2DCB3|nr:DHA2 family efflux MFS transporter permease subunit [Nucisporomicrobium flavum]